MRTPSLVLYSRGRVKFREEPQKHGKPLRNHNPFREQSVKEVAPREEEKKPAKPNPKPPKPTKPKQKPANDNPAGDSSLAKLKGPADSVTAVCWDPSNKYIAVGGEDGQQKTVCLFSVESLHKPDRKQFKITTPGDSPSCATISKNGRFLVVGTKQNQSLVAYGLLPEAKKNKDGKVFQLLREYEKTKNGNIVSIEITPDSKHILVCYQDTTVCLWDTKGNELAKFSTKQMRYYMATMSSDATMLAIATSTGDVKLYRMNWGTIGDDKTNAVFHGFETRFFVQLLRHETAVMGISFIGDGKQILTTSKDGTWKCWQLEGDIKRGFQAKTIRTVQSPINKPFFGHALSPDEKTLATITNDPSTPEVVHFWRVADGGLLGTISESGSVLSISWSPDCAHIVAACSDGFARVYKAITA